MRLAIEVPVTSTPVTSTPVAAGGKPSISAAQAMTWRSTAIGAWSRPPRLAFSPPAGSSASMPMAVPPPCTQPMKPGCRLPVA
jgi:hypothetical protein